MGKDKRTLLAHAGLCLGFGLALFLTYFATWSDLHLGFRLSLDINDILMWWAIPCCASLGVTLIAIGIVRRFERSGADGGASGPGEPTTMSLSLCAVLSCAVLLGGYALSALSVLDVAVRLPLSAVLTGMGLGGLLALWILPFERVPFADAIPIVLVCAILSCTMHVVSRSLTLAGSAAMYVASAAACLAVFPALVRKPVMGADTESAEIAEIAKGAPDANAPGYAARFTKCLQELISPTLCVIATICLVSIARRISLGSVSYTSNAPASILGILVLVACFLVLLLFDFARQGNPSTEGVSLRLEIPELFCFVFPVLATLLVILALDLGTLVRHVSSLVLAIHSVMLVLLIPTGVKTARKYRVDPLGACGISVGAVFICHGAAAWLAYVIFAGNAASERTLVFAFILITLYILTMIYVFVRRRTRSLKEKAGQAPVPEGAAAQGEDADGEAGAGSVMVVDSVEQRCLRLREQYGLSQREYEVLSGIAHGRDMKYLAESLCLSVNTIRSHCKTLYVKLGVHRKQELLDLLHADE